MTELRRIQIQGSVDSNNSTSTPLSGDAVFTGTSTDILDCGIIFVNVFTDVASATDGLSIQQSSDGTNWDHSDDYTIAAGANKNFSINPHSRYFRVVYTNGSGAQSTFRLQTICKSQNAKPSSHRVKDEIIGDDDITLVKAAITGENGSGDWHNVKTTTDGNLTISDNSNGLAIAEGNVTGKTFIHKFGNAPDFDATDNEVDVWDGAEDNTSWEQMNYQFSSSADIDSLSSSDNSDTQDIEIQGLDSNWDLVTQTITLTGQTRAALSTNLIRVFRMKNTNSTDTAGHVFCYVDVSLSGGVPSNTANIRAIIHPGNNQTEMAIYTIPNGKTGYIRSWYSSSAGASKTTNYISRLYTRPNGGVFQLKHRSARGDSVPYQHTYVEPEGPFAAKTDIKMTTQATATGVTAASVSSGFDIVLVDN